MRWVVVLMFVIVLSAMASAACPEGEGYLGNKDLGSCVRISQTCASCTSVNISSVVLSTSNQTLATNLTMQNFGNGEWVQQFCNTSQFGNYYIQGVGNLDGTATNFKSCFDIGQNLSTSDAIIYVVFLLFLFMLLLSFFYFIIILPSENDKNPNGAIIGVVRLKYIRIFIIAMCYPLIMIILNLMNGLAVNYATLGIFAGTLGFLFETMLRGAWVFTVLIFLWMFYLLVHDSNVLKNIDKIGGMRFNGRN